MVPLADVFNHKASVVALAPGYEVHGGDGDGESGSSGDDDYDEGDETGHDSRSGSGSDEEEEEVEVGKQHSHHEHHEHCGDGCNLATGAAATLPSVAGASPAVIHGLCSGEQQQGSEGGTHVQDSNTVAGVSHGVIPALLPDLTRTPCPLQPTACTCASRWASLTGTRRRSRLWPPRECLQAPRCTTREQWGTVVGMGGWRHWMGHTGH